MSKLKYVKLFENFEENKIPKNITIQFTEKFHNRFDYEESIRDAAHRTPSAVKLYPGRLHRIKVATITKKKTIGDRLSEKVAKATEFYYAVWYPETKSIAIERITTNEKSEYEKTEESNYGSRSIYPKDILLFPNATADYHSFLMDHDPLIEANWKFIQSMSNKGELHVGVQGYKEQKYENYAIGEKIGEFFIIERMEY